MSQEPPQRDPYKTMWQMTPVGGSSKGSNLKIGSGVIAGLVTLVPFGVVASVLWGWWGDDTDWSTGGWVTLLIGLAAALSVGGFVASES